MHVPDIVLKGLHFNVLLGVSWLHKAKASIQISEGSQVVDTVKMPYKLRPEPAAFVVDEGIQIYFTEHLIMKPGRTMGAPVCPLAVIGGEIY